MLGQRLQSSEQLTLLQEMGYINERFVDPTIELTETLAITLMDELSRLQVQSAPSLLREFYDAAAHEFPELIYSQRGKFNRFQLIFYCIFISFAGSLWFCSLKMTWPVDFQTQKMYHLSKSRTKQRVCALAVKKLSEVNNGFD